MTSPAYYEQVYAKKIFESRPVTVARDAGYELHLLTCERDMTIAMWALKTFYHYADARPRLVIHDDGSLTEQSVRTYEEHFVGCRVVRYAEVMADARFRAQFDAFPLCETWRFRSRPPLSIRVFDFPYFAETPYIFEFDSDVLFFSRPDEVLALCDARETFASTDYKSSYVFAPSTARKVLGIELAAKINTGLAGFPRTFLDFPAVESMLQAMIDNNVPPGIFRASHPWIEQTVTACLLCRKAPPKMLDVERYALSTMLLRDTTVYQHFVGDGSRPFFYDWGLRRLDERGFLDAQARG